MSTPRINYSPAMTQKLVSESRFGAEGFFLIDVGASGGIENYWRVFGKYLMADGFDPLVKECARLNLEEVSNKIVYRDYFVSAKGESEKGWDNQPFSRTSAAKAQENFRFSSALHYNNSDEEVVYTEKHTSIDEFYEQKGETIDFIKIDTDGSDYQVLLGAEKTLKEKKVLGVFVECQFHGGLNPDSNVWNNIDRFLRDQGFSLFDLCSYRYTRACLPGRFAHNIYAQTLDGQVLWGDALYLRDFAIDNYEATWDISLSASNILKLACIFEIFGIPDCAAELLIKYRAEIEATIGIDVNEYLNLLAQSTEPPARSYSEHIASFEDNPESFLPRTSYLSKINRLARVIQNLGFRKRSMLQ